jgi:hypothetical protein
MRFSWGAAVVERVGCTHGGVEGLEFGVDAGCMQEEYRNGVIGPLLVVK